MWYYLSPILSHFDLRAMERHWFHSLLAPGIHVPFGSRIGRCEFVRYFSVFIWSMRVFGDFAVLIRSAPSFWKILWCSFPGFSNIYSSLTQWQFYLRIFFTTNQVVLGLPV